MTAAADLWLNDPAYRGLLDDVIENPDDDTPRLVMADWLEERGDEVAVNRARFIRLQLSRAKVSEHSPEAWASRREENRLLSKHRSEWLGRLEKITSKVTFDRGFPDDVVAGVAVFQKNADALFSLTPVRRLQILRISQTKLTMADLAAVDGMKRLRGLSVRNSSLGDARVADLLRVLKMPHLAELDLTGTDLGPRALAALRKADLPRLRSLSLAINGAISTADQVTGALAGRPLSSLDLSRTNLDAQELAALAERPGLASLTELELSGDTLGARAAARLFASPNLGRLTRLGLALTDVRQGGATALSRCERLAGLRHLDVSACQLEGRGLANLLSGPHLTALERLDLGGNGLDAAAVETLAAWPGLASVRSLGLSFNLIGNAGLKALLDSQYLAPLTTLEANSCDLRQGVGTMVGFCEKLESLAKLDLSYNSLQEADTLGLIEGMHLPALQQIKVGPARMSAATSRRWGERFPNLD